MDAAGQAAEFENLCQFGGPGGGTLSEKRICCGGDPMSEHLTYQGAGVDTEQQDRIMPNLIDWIQRTFQNRPDSVKLPLGYFANVIDVGNELAIALSTDGVGTKILVAELMNKYDTIGID